jgi:hypothetical protein
MNAQRNKIIRATIEAFRDVLKMYDAHCPAIVICAHNCDNGLDEIMSSTEPDKLGSDFAAAIQYVIEATECENSKGGTIH